MDPRKATSLSVGSGVTLFGIWKLAKISNLAPVVQRVDSTIHWINQYPLDNSISSGSTHPMDCDEKKKKNAEHYPWDESLYVY